MTWTKTLLVAGCIACATASTSDARTWHVKAHGRGDAPTIQAAIDSAQDGDTVILGNGTYTGYGNRDIDFRGKAITVRSQSDNPRQCIIDCQGSESDPHRGFYFHSGEDSNSVLRGVTISNGFAPIGEVSPSGDGSRDPVSVDDYPRSFGGAILCVGSRDQGSFCPKFENCMFIGNTAGPGAGTWADFAGGGVYVVGDGETTFIRCRFADNLGGGLFCGSLGSVVRLVDCAFAGNLPTGVSTNWGAVTLNQCVISNHPENGLHARGGVTAVDCIFSDNLGTGFYADGHDAWGAELKNCQFSRNGNSGLRVHDALVTVENCAFFRNENAGIVGSWDSGMEVSNCQFSRNAHGVIPGRYARLTHCTFSENSGQTGGGVQVQNIMDGSRVRIDDCAFVGNTATEGGALFFRDTLEDDARPDFEVRNCTFRSNVAIRGGALYCRGFSPSYEGEPTSARLVNCTFYDNESEQGAAIFCDGLVLVDIQNTIVAKNKGGAAVSCGDGAPAPVFTCGDIFGNDGGDWVGCIQDQLGVNGNINLDPLFCRPDRGEFALSSRSPCLPTNNSCEVLIGAYGEGCSGRKTGPVSVATGAEAVDFSATPNPFNPATRISYTLSTQAFVRLAVYDVAGRLIEKLVSQTQTAGLHVLDWNTENLPSGIYFGRLEAGSVVETRKLILLK